MGKYKDRLPAHKTDLPDNFNPYDMALKTKLNANADDMNFISVTRRYPYLACGAKKSGVNEKCGHPAGYGTDHVGFGRCKHHGGSCTGPKTEEGKAAVSKNAVVHGFYSKALFPDEQEYFEGFMSQEVGLEFEIALLKSKITKYLVKHTAKWQRIYEAKKTQGELKAAEAADKDTRVWYTNIVESSDGDNVSTYGTSYYHAATIEDKPLLRALELLSRLVDKHAKLKGLDRTDADNILENINAELRAASCGQVSISWGGKPQTREDKE